MTDKSRGQIVRLLARPTGRHVRRFDVDRFTRAEVANFTSIDYAVLVDVDLVTKNRVVERVFVLLDQVVDALLRQQADVVLQIFVALLGQLSRLFQSTRPFRPSTFAFSSRKSIERLFKLGIVHLLRSGLAASVRGQIDGNDFLLFLVELAGVTLAPEIAGRRLELVGNDHDAAALVLKRLSYRIELRLNLA